jgi:hypothetical protein
VSASLDALVEHYGDIVIWGINSYVYEFVQELSLRNAGRIHLVDKSELRQGLRVAESRVVSPKVVTEKGVKCIVVAVVQYFSNLSIQLREEFPEVERIVSITDLLVGSAHE